MPQSRKILRIFFKIWIFNVPRDSVWRLVRGWKVQSLRDSEIFMAYLATLLQAELPVAKNTQINFSKFFFQMFWRLVLATCTRFDSVAKIACFAQNGSVFEPFQFSLEFSWLFIVLPISNLSQTHHVTLEEPPFLHFFKKRYGFSYFLIPFHVYSMCFLDFDVVVWVLWHMLFMYGMGLLYWVG